MPHFFDVFDKSEWMRKENMQTNHHEREDIVPEYTQNRVTLLGRLTRDPEIRSLNGGDQVATFSVATTDTWKRRQRPAPGTQPIPSRRDLEPGADRGDRARISKKARA